MKQVDQKKGGAGMSQAIRYAVKKDVILWAIEESQKNMCDVELKFPKISEWICGNSAPTMKQIENLANYLKVPFGYMFLATPPKTNVMKAEFRSIDNKLPTVSKNLKDTLLEMDRNQSWMSEFRRELGCDKLNIIKDFESGIDNSAAIIETAELAKQLLGIEEEWYLTCSSHEKAYIFLREKLSEVLPEGTIIRIITQK